MPVNLRCPTVGTADLAPDELSSRLTRLLRELNARSGPEPRYFGREIRLAYRQLETLEGEDGGGDLVAGRSQLLRRIFTRPASEPILFSVWPRFCGGIQTPESYAALASMLSSKTVTLASSRMRTVGDDDETLVFEERSSSATWLRDIARARDGQGCHVKRALYAYVRTVLSHPFSDGNGRIARAMLQFQLGAHGVLDGPKLAVAPEFYLHWKPMTLHLRELSANGVWSKYFDAVLPRLEQAAAAALVDA